MLQRATWLMILLSSLAIMVGNVVLGAVVAPTLFRILERGQAGQGFGNILAMWTEYFAWPLVLICAAALSIIAIVRLLRRQSNWFIAIAVLGAALVTSHWWSANLVTESLQMRDEMRSVEAQNQSTPPSSKADDSRLTVLKKQFDYLHRNSTRAFMVETITALLIVLISSGSLVFTKESSPSSKAKNKARIDEDTIY